ncbi:hypothetical protein EJ05DRAFT_502901 [Pseudovirgaria hyperparasitica]|uniref:THIF-type NAD/FAD binding fold domain-containing protein n=1 Tax=Pseudovirgaria hyperparasitica TaxID=470096 RepID=A0A6A6W0I2_9PEZI|nr:uncharacterized protein EJ05DRAFT_502901 [Pseudovirgaria hyperparasitica]KAF2755440.1 hypothetical protein EJ05DRAFT_502901 [Pseudovirgaria hyperparasitica]
MAAPQYYDIVQAREGRDVLWRPKAEVRRSKCRCMNLPAVLWSFVGALPTSSQECNFGSSLRPGRHETRALVIPQDMESPTPPILHGPTSKEKKYDRQLRLWAASGQAALEESRLLLINSGPGVVGIETLKNLVLPGVGHFTILDSGIITEADLGVNFFLEEQHLGGYRAEHTCNLLKELNPDVQGDFITDHIESFLSNQLALKPYTLIMVTSPVKAEILAQISSHASTTGTPIFYIHCVGFYAQFSVHLSPSFPIVDTHPDPLSTQDLRLLTPWPSLLDLARRKTTGLEQMNEHDHGHVPYVLLLLHYLDLWKAEHDGQAPGNYKDKTAFRESVAKGARTNTPEGGEENYDEAVAAVLKSLNPPSLGSGVREVFEAAECQNLTTQSASFWIIAHAISTFHKTHSALPLPGSVPDMKAQSKDYIELQNTYKTKARHDIGEVTENVRAIEKQLGRTSQIEDSEIEAFCKGAAHIKLVRGRPFHIMMPGQMPAWGDRAKFAALSLTDPDSLVLLYIAFLAYDSFISSHTTGGLGSASVVPGENNTESDVEMMASMAYAITDDLIQQSGIAMSASEQTVAKGKIEQYVRELVRAGGSELHNISSLAGGLIAQEVIKVVTKQYVPVDNVCLFDGIMSKSSVLRL